MWLGASHIKGQVPAQWDNGETMDFVAFEEKQPRPDYDKNGDNDCAMLVFELEFVILIFKLQHSTQYRGNGSLGHSRVYNDSTANLREKCGQRSCTQANADAKSRVFKVRGGLVPRLLNRKLLLHRSLFQLNMGCCRGAL